MTNYQHLFKYDFEINNNLIILHNESKFEAQQQTNEAFSEKWITWWKNVGNKKKRSFMIFKKIGILSFTVLKMKSNFLHF